MNNIFARVKELPTVKVTKDGFELESDFIYTLLIYSRLYTVEIKKGFKYDGPSVPWYLRWFASPADIRWLIPSAAHDELYRSVVEGFCTAETTSGTVLLTRKEADDVFLLLMLQLRFPSYKAHLAYKAVRIFGRFSTKGKDL